MANFALPRLDKDEQLKELLLPYCRLKKGDVWSDPKRKHKIGCFSAEESSKIKKILRNKKAKLAVHDPPYNIVAFQKMSAKEYADWCKVWVLNTEQILDDDSSLYVWLGADQNNHLEPFAEFIIMMKKSNFNTRSFITMRNQRGFGTQKNWMAVRQELLYYTKGEPAFNIDGVYTKINKVLKGYFKDINGELLENTERGKSDYIRASNVWIDVQQVFYLMEENVNGCYAQKPLKALERIINVSSNPNDIVVDFFAHAGTTLIACEKLKRKCITVDIDPIHCEISIRRLENFRENGKTGWQKSNPFAEEILSDTKIKNHLEKKYNLEIPKEL